MAKLLYYKDPVTEKQIVKDYLNRIIQKAKQEKGYDFSYRVLKYQITKGLELLCELGYPEGRKLRDIQMPIPQPSGNITLQIIFRPMVSAKNNVGEFRIDHETLGSFRILFFRKQYRRNEYFIATYAFMKTKRDGKNPHWLQNYIEKTDKIAENYEVKGEVR